MPSFTIELGKRQADNLELTREEAVAMEREGFRFAEFREERDCYRLSSPYRMVLILDRGTVTLTQ